MLACVPDVGMPRPRRGCLSANRGEIPLREPGKGKRPAEVDGALCRDGLSGWRRWWCRAHLLQEKSVHGGADRVLYIEARIRGDQLPVALHIPRRCWGGRRWCRVGVRGWASQPHRHCDRDGGQRGPHRAPSPNQTKPAVMAAAMSPQTSRNAA